MLFFLEQAKKFLHRRWDHTGSSDSPKGSKNCSMFEVVFPQASFLKVRDIEYLALTFVKFFCKYLMEAIKEVCLN